MRVCLVEDCGAVNLEPLSLTRPVFELLCGQTSLAVKQCQFFAASEVGVLIRPYLVELFRQEHPKLPVNDLDWLRASPTILVNGRWLPPAGQTVDASRPCVGTIGDEVVYAVVAPDKLIYCSPHTVDDCLHTWKETLSCRPAGGRLIAYPWELVEHNAEQLSRDFTPAPQASWPCIPNQVALVGSARWLRLHPAARLDPMVVLDTTQGPITIDREAVVTAFSRIEGPCYIGPGTQVFGAKVRAGTTLGPNCRIGGEVEASIVHGHSNKYHDGFLGHSYVGEWVNLGAGTHNSDLRNDYGPVNVTIAGQPVSTRLTKVGCFLGDHTKTGLGTLLNTGTHVGVFGNLLPSGLCPRYIPSFCSWWNGRLVDNADLSRLLHTAACAMRRRHADLTEPHTRLYEHLFRQTTMERQRAVREADKRHRRRSA